MLCVHIALHDLSCLGLSPQSGAVSSAVQGCTVAACLLCRAHFFHAGMHPAASSCPASLASAHAEATLPTKQLVSCRKRSSGLFTVPIGWYHSGSLPNQLRATSSAGPTACL